jgi:hypothetical protein
VGGKPVDDFLDAMESSMVADTPQKIKPVSITGPDWFSWRKRNFDVGIAKTGEEGSLEDWQQLLRTEGADKLTSAVIKARGTGRKGERIWYSRVLECLAGEPEEKAKADPAASKRSHIATLVWCICHSAKCYADAIAPWTPVEGDSVSVRLPMIGRVTRTPLQDPHTPERRAKLEAMAKAARMELLTQCGFPDDARWNGRLSDTVMATPHLIAWLRSMRLVP